MIQNIGLSPKIVVSGHSFKEVLDFTKVFISLLRYGDIKNHQYLNWYILFTPINL